MQTNLLNCGVPESGFRRQGNTKKHKNLLETFENNSTKAHKITCLYPLEIPDLKPPDAFGIPIVSTPPCLRNSSSKNPPCLRNSKKPSVVLYGYFLELPIQGKTLLHLGPLLHSGPKGITLGTFITFRDVYYI